MSLSDLCFFISCGWSHIVWMFQVFEGIKQKEETKQTEFAAKAQEYKAMQAQAETVRFTNFNDYYPTF